MKDSYRTISKAVRATEVKVMGSRFIADLFAVSSKEEVESHLEAIRKEFYDASHHCYAYRIGNTAELLRAADDGEPAGTAGRPILMVLEGADLTNVLCIVTRYFGGTKLGTGGLARAYSEAAQSVVAAAEQKEVFLTDTFSLRCTYEELPAVERILSQFNTLRYDAEFGETISMKADIRRSFVADFKKKMNEAFYGNVAVTEG